MEANTPQNSYILPEEYTQTIELADGTTLEGSGSLNTTNGDLWIWVKEKISFIEAVTMFSNTQKTSTITVNRAPGDTSVYSGYTRVTSANADVFDKISICLRKD